MKEHVYITGTGERVREHEGLVEVGLSSEAQASLGTLLHFHVPKVGKWVKKGDHLFVVEGGLTAAEFYAPESGKIIYISKQPMINDNCLILIARSNS